LIYGNNGFQNFITLSNIGKQIYWLIHQEKIDFCFKTPLLSNQEKGYYIYKG